LRFQVLTAAALMALIGCATIAQATGQTEYLAQRARVQLTSFDFSRPLATQLPGHDGQVTELTGIVTNIIPRENALTFMLQVDPNQAVLIATTRRDPDILVRHQLRVLARIPAAGNALEMLSVTPLAPLPVVAVTPAPVAVATSPNRPVALPAPVNSGATALTTAPAQRTAGSAPASAPAATPKSAPAPAPQHPSSHPVIAARKRHSRHMRQVAKRAPAATFSASVAPAQRTAQWYAAKIRQFNVNTAPALALRIATLVLAKCKIYGVDPRLAMALIARESRFNPHAVSPVGARGLGQLMPGTAALLHVIDPFDIAQNIDGTVRYLARQMNKFSGQVVEALAAYNAGPGNVERFGGVPPFRETQNYVSAISIMYQALTHQVL